MTRRHACCVSHCCQVDPKAKGCMGKLRFLNFSIAASWEGRLGNPWAAAASRWDPGSRPTWKLDLKGLLASVWPLLPIILSIVNLDGSVTFPSFIRERMASFFVWSPGGECPWWLCMRDGRLFCISMRFSCSLKGSGIELMKLGNPAGKGYPRAGRNLLSERRGAGYGATMSFTDLL